MKRKLNKKGILVIVVGIIILIGIIVTLCLVLSKDKPKNDKPKVNKKKEEVIEEVKIIDEDSKTRPYAVMINCHNDALPQAGLDNAYIVYEIMVEGGITRMMALFKDDVIDKIGSVRSARTQFLDYVYENDAIYAHAGGAKDALNRISSEGINDVDVDGIYGKRDTSLIRNWEHTLFTSTDLLKSASDNMGFRQTTDSGNLLTYSAKPIDLSKFESAIEANNISIRYSDYRTSNYTYDSKNKVYLRSMNNTNNIDLVTGKQYEVKNIIVYGVDYSSYCDHRYCLYQKIDNVGTGDGYYITEGIAIPIIWEKSSKNARTIYKFKDTGKELIVNDGNTYIQIYPSRETLSIN